MNLEDEVWAVMFQSDKALTVEQVAHKVAERLQDDIRVILNGLVKGEKLSSVHGGGGYTTHYKMRPLNKRI